MRLITSACGFVLLMCLSMPLVAQTPPSRPTSAPVARSKASLEPLLQQGSDALLAGQVSAARAAFQDAIAIDPRNVKAHHGLALCFIAQKENGKARDLLDKCLTFTTTPDRALVLNAAAVNLTIKNNMRAAKLAKDYLAAHPKELDEPMLNALGTALSSATASERKNRFFTEFAAFYIIANQRLEAARPGYKRFGSEWFTAPEVDTKNAAVAVQQKQIDRLSDEVASAEERLMVADKELARQKNLILNHGEAPNNYYFMAAQTNYDMCKANLQQAQDRYDKLVATLERPKFPTSIAMVSMDEVSAPSVSKPAVAVAEATPRTGTGTVTPRTPRTPRVTPGNNPNNTPNDPAPPKVDTPAVAVDVPKAPRKVRVTQYAAAFPVASDLVVTAGAVIEEGATLQLQASDGQSISATLLKKDEASGLALLKVEGRKLAALTLADSFTGGPVTCAAYPTVDLFSPAAQSLSGSAGAPKESGWTVSLSNHPRLAGSPLLSGGKVVGVCVAPRDAEKAKLPAVPLEALKAFVGSSAQAGNAPGDPIVGLLQLVTTRESMSGE